MYFLLLCTRAWLLCVCVEQGFTATQLQLVEDNAQLTLQREKEISQIVKSIHDLNEIFKDLASMVVDQVNYFRCFCIYIL